MAIIAMNKDKVVSYIPKFGGNRGSEDICIIDIKFVPFVEVQRNAALMEDRLRTVSDPNEITRKRQEVQREHLIKQIKGISGYYREDGSALTDVSEFVETADANLIYELVAAVDDSEILRAGQVKNSERVSDGIDKKPTEAPSTVTSAPSETSSSETAGTGAVSPMKQED